MKRHISAKSQAHACASSREKGTLPFWKRGRYPFPKSKKSKRGIATPKEDLDIIHARLKVAQALAQELNQGLTTLLANIE